MDDPIQVAREALAQAETMLEWEFLEAVELLVRALGSLAQMTSRAPQILTHDEAARWYLVVVRKDFNSLEQLHNATLDEWYQALTSAITTIIQEETGDTK